jgi:uncharacterized protein
MLRMFRNILYLMAAIIAAVLLINVFSGANLKEMLLPKDTKVFARGTLIIHTKDNNNYGFNIDIARTESSRVKGLMNRKTLAENEGMLLLFDNPKIVGLWMKDTYLPLDMIFLNDKGVIVQIVENTVPLSTDSIMAQHPTTSVLEINAGLSKKLNIDLGDTVIYKVNP